jgi:hypothetical protein
LRELLEWKGDLLISVSSNRKLLSIHDSKKREQGSRTPEVGDLRLHGGLGSSSFAGMRVVAVEQILNRTSGAGVVPGDAPVSLAIKNFLGAIESDDSMFSLSEPMSGPSAEEPPGGRVYAADIILEFRQSELGRQRSLHFLLLEKLIELLKEAGSQESLEATLCLTSRKQESSNQKTHALWVRLAAKGESAEQAALRWGLGLSHLQQALLFTSRHLRLHMAQASD